MEEINEEKICRICHCGENELEILFYPCKCSGSIKYTHEKCMLEWLRINGRNICELCGYEIKMRPIYKENMPEILPLSDYFGVIKNHLMNYIIIYEIIILSIYFILYYTPRNIYLLMNCSYKFVSDLNFTNCSLNVFENLYKYNFSENANGCFCITFCILFLLIIYGYYRNIIYLSDPYWFQYDHPDDEIIEKYRISHATSNDDPSSDEDFTFIGTNQTVNDNFNNNDEFVWPIRIDLNKNIFEIFLYVILCSFVVISFVTCSLIVISGLPLLIINNKFIKYIVLEPCGQILLNMFVYYFIFNIIFFMLNYLFRKRSISILGIIHSINKLLFIISLEYIIMPILYGFVFIYCTRGIKENNKNMLTFPLSDADISICYCIGILSVACSIGILVYLNDKFRKGLLVPSSDSHVNFKRIVENIHYETILILLQRVLNVSIKYIVFIIFLQHVVPFYFSYKLFLYINDRYSDSERRLVYNDIYIMIYSFPYFVRSIPIKEYFDTAFRWWFEYIGRKLQLESYIFGNVDIEENQKVYDLLGEHYYSSVHVIQRSHNTSSLPYIRNNNFYPNVYYLYILTFILVSVILTLTGILSVIFGSFFGKYIINANCERFDICIFIGVFFILFIHMIIDKTIYIFKPNNGLLVRTYISSNEVTLHLISLIILFSLIIPLLNGLVLEHIWDNFKLRYDQTKIMCPFYTWFNGIILLKVQLSLIDFIPLSLLRKVNIFYSLKLGIDTYNYYQILYDFCIPYITNCFLIISIPYITIFGLSFFIHVSIESQYNFYYHSYYFALIIMITFCVKEFIFKIIYKFIHIVRDYQYLLRHELQNIDSVN